MHIYLNGADGITGNYVVKHICLQI